MKKSRFDKDPHIGLRDAFEIVGKDALGDEWNEGVFDRDSQHYKTVENRLRNVLKSGEVDAHWHTSDFLTTGKLRPEVVDHEFCLICLHDNTMFHVGVNQPVLCKIHANQLHLALLEASEKLSPHTAADEKKCFDWFMEWFSDPKITRLTVTDVEALAKKKFPRVSGAGIKRARRDAIEKTRRKDIFRVGRPKIKSMS